MKNKPVKKENNIKSPIYIINGAYIREWLMLGPFFPDDLETDFLADVGGEANVLPQEGDAVTTADGKTLRWKRYNSKGNIIDLIDAIGNYENATAYAFCLLQSEPSPPAPLPEGEGSGGDVQINLGSDDGVTVWINGQRVHSNPVDRPLILNEDMFEVELKAGVNCCLVKVSQGLELWGFAMQVSPSNYAVISGIITDKIGTPIPNALVSLEQDEKEIAQTQTDASGYYRISVHPARGLYSLSAISGELGGWQMDFPLREGEHRTIDLTLKRAINISGTLLMLDDETPHVAVPVQAVTEGRVIATTRSNEQGKYQFINLKPGRYQVRCQTMGGCVYYNPSINDNGMEEWKDGKMEGKEVGSSISSILSYLPPFQSKIGGEILEVTPDTSLSNIDFRFAPFKRGRWKSYNSSSGLADNCVTDIKQTPDGMMWFGTRDGVSRYDGKTFITFTAKDGLALNWVNALHSDPDGVMWFGTWGHGVFRGVYPEERRDGKQFVNFTTKDGLAENRVMTIYRDVDGIMWFGTRDGVSRYDGEIFINFAPKDGLAHYWVYAIDCFVPRNDADGVLWFGTAGGVSRYDGETFINFTTKDGLADNNVRVIHSDPDGVLWFGTAGGVSRYDGETFATFTTKDGLANNDVRVIHGDPAGVLWFGTAGGVSRYDGKAFVTFTTQDGLADNAVTAIHSASDGMMWFGTWGGGVSCYDRGQIVTLTTKDGLANNDVRVIYGDSDGVMWLGTSEGVSYYSGEEFVNLATKDGLAHNVVKSILGNSDGVMWFGTAHGVSRYDGRNFLNFTTKDGLPHNDVTAIFRAPDGVIWFATAYGVSRYNGNEFLNFTTRDGLAHNVVTAIHSASDGVMWFGTRGGISRGVYPEERRDGKEFITFTIKNGLVNDSVFTVYSTPDGMMWFGTRGGVSRYDGKEFVNFTTEDGLAHNWVNAIELRGTKQSVPRNDADGIMWFGTEGGVSCYDGITLTSLDTRDGLTGNAVRAIYQDSDGCLWFGTDSGLTCYRRNTIPPHVRIVAVTTDNRYTNLDALPSAIAGAHITFEYSSIDFKTHPQKQLYRYKLEGYDTDWNQPTKETRADYTNLPIGEYTFFVQAIDRDLNYSEPATVRMTVQADPRLIALRAEVAHLRQEVGRKYHFEQIIGCSEGIKQVQALMEKAIDSGLTVLISGETGTGKELVAKAIHYSSPRKDKPLLSLNCGAVPKDLVASMLFGHCKGAFTGAHEDKMGLFEAAEGGTLILDEIGEMPLQAQVYLLRVLEERKVQRLGEHTHREVDVRVIAITNRNLAREVEGGRFREDLYYRLSEFPIHVPALRERSEDIPLLAQHFLQEINKKLEGFAPDVLEMLKSYHWPGNVRELRNVIRRAAAFVEEGLRIQTYHFPSHITRGESLIQEIICENTGYSEVLDNFRRRLITQVLKECDGNRHEAARSLRMHRPNLIALMKRLGIKSET